VSAKKSNLRSLKKQFIVDCISLPRPKSTKVHRQVRQPPSSYPRWWLKQLREAKRLLSEGQVGVLRHFGGIRGEHVSLYRMRIDLGKEIDRLGKLTDDGSNRHECHNSPSAN
jgi:hypothetical protein